MQKLFGDMMWQDGNFDTVCLDPHYLQLDVGPEKRPQEQQQEFSVLETKIGRKMM